MAPREPSLRAKTLRSVRLNDLRGFNYKFNKSNFRSNEDRDIYYFIVKCYEQELRGLPPSTLATKMPNFFRRFSESIILRPLPEGFHGFKFERKKRELQKLFDELVELATVGVSGANQGVDMQVNNPDDMQVDEGRAADIPGIANTLQPPDDASLQNVARNQLGKVSSRPPVFLAGNPQGRPPPSYPDDSYMHPYEFHQFMSKVKRRASGFQDVLPEFEGWHQGSMLLADKFDSLEELELSEALKNDSNTHLRSRQKEIYAQLEEDITSEDPQNQLTEPLTESISPGASYSSQATGFGEDVQRGVRYTATCMAHGEQDCLHPNPGISDVLETIPRRMGHFRKNMADIHPQVNVNNMAGKLQYQFSKTTTEHVDPQASHPQVYDPGDKQSGGEYLTTVPYVGQNNYTLPIVAMDCSISAQPPAIDERVMRAQEQQHQFDTPSHESLPSLLWWTDFPSPPDWLEWFPNINTPPV